MLLVKDNIYRNVAENEVERLKAQGYKLVELKDVNTKKKNKKTEE